MRKKHGKVGLFFSKFKNFESREEVFLFFDVFKLPWKDAKRHYFLKKYAIVVEQGSFDWTLNFLIKDFFHGIFPALKREQNSMDQEKRLQKLSWAHDQLNQIKVHRSSSSTDCVRAWQSWKLDFVRKVVLLLSSSVAILEEEDRVGRRTKPVTIENQVTMRWETKKVARLWLWRTLGFLRVYSVKKCQRLKVKTGTAAEFLCDAKC